MLAALQLLAEVAPEGYMSMPAVAALIAAILGAGGVAGWKANKTARETGAAEERARLKTDTTISPDPLNIRHYPEYATRAELKELERKFEAHRLEQNAIYKQLFDRINPLAENVAKILGTLEAMQQADARRK